MTKRENINMNVQQEINDLKKQIELLKDQSLAQDLKNRINILETSNVSSDISCLNRQNNNINNINNESEKKINFDDNVNVELIKGNIKLKCKKTDIISCDYVSDEIIIQFVNNVIYRYAEPFIDDGKKQNILTILNSTIKNRDIIINFDNSRKPVEILLPRKS